MSDVSVDLLWQRRHRGLVSVGPATLDDAGNALLIKPDEFESRTYQVLHFTPSGEVRELAAVSVERIRQWIGTADGAFLIGVTADDVYLFRDGRKTRFMTDRRATYADVALAPEPGWFICGYSDEVFATYGLAFGEASGRLSWTRDLTVGVSRVAISGNGKVITVALVDGVILAVDSLRATLWEHAVEEFPTALAMSENGAACLIGTDQGTVRALNADGSLRWSTSIGVPIVSVALSGDGKTAVVAATDGSTHLLVRLDAAGNPSWEFELEGHPNRVCCSRDGRHVLVAMSHGAASCFLCEGGVGSRSDEQALDEAGRLLVTDPVGAWEKISPLAASAPHLMEVASLFAEARAAALTHLMTRAEDSLGNGDYATATEDLDQAARIDPWDRSLFELRRRCRELQRDAGVRAAESAELLLNLDAALTAWTEVIELDPVDGRAREGLRRVRGQQAESLIQLGDQAFEAGRVDEALTAWREAQRLAPAEALESRIRTAEVRRCVDAGIAHYEAQRLPEAMFQLKKALTLDAENEDARRYLGYAQGLSGDSGIADRFARLE